MAYMFNDDKTKFPFVRDLLWSGNESASSVTDWSFNATTAGINLGDYSEFEIHTQEGAILFLSETGSLITDYSGSGALITRYVQVDADLNNVEASQCYLVGGSATHNDYLIPTRLYGIKVGYTNAT